LHYNLIFAKDNPKNRILVKSIGFTPYPFQFAKLSQTCLNFRKTKAFEGLQSAYITATEKFLPSFLM
jgi:hypothetical protein